MRNATLNGAHYARIDTAYNAQNSNERWFNGDSDFSGNVKGADYALIDAAYDDHARTMASLLTYLDTGVWNSACDNTPSLAAVKDHLLAFDEEYEDLLREIVGA